MKRSLLNHESTFCKHCFYQHLLALWKYQNRSNSAKLMQKLNISIKLAMAACNNYDGKFIYERLSLYPFVINVLSQLTHAATLNSTTKDKIPSNFRHILSIMSKWRHFMTSLQLNGSLFGDIILFMKSVKHSCIFMRDIKYSTWNLF